tara:strand:+ start:74 stop:190 length:117 start_codon:yes stop_codon:yes gene_type:complete
MRSKNTQDAHGVGNLDIGRDGWFFAGVVSTKTDQYKNG